MDKPKECSVCLDARMLHCLQNKQHLIVREEAKEHLRRLFEASMNSPERYKVKSGEEGRKH